MNNKKRSFESIDSNSLNSMIKKTSMNENRRHNNGKKLLMTITLSSILLGATLAIGLGEGIFAFAAKPQAVIDWSNGFPSGPHSTMNIHGKKADYNCDNSLEGIELYGSSVFVPLYGTSKIDIVSNKRSDLTEGKAIDPCAAPFGQPGNDDDPALYQLPTGEHQVYWRILGKPNNGNGNDGSSEARITSPTLKDQCNFLPVAYEDGTTVESFDPDAQVPLALVAFNALEKHTDGGDLNFQNTESIYLDANNDFMVDAGDTLLYGPGEAIGTALINFAAQEKHEDTGATVNWFDSGETIYLDADNSDTVTDGDTRIANASSQGLPEDQGGDAVNCEDETLVGLGLVNNQGAFKKTEEGLKRFGDETGKGKSKAVEITDLFLWTGSVCDAAILDTWDTDMDGSLTMHDFEVGAPDGQIDAAELALVLSILEADAQIIIDAAEAAVLADPNADVDDTNSNGVIDTQAEFAYFLEIQFAEFNCQTFIDEWVFNVADIVLYGFDYENNGTTLSQIRFYPTETTDFTQ